MSFSIKVDGTVVWSTSGAPDEISLRSRKGEAGRFKVDDDTVVNIVTSEPDRDVLTRNTGPVANAGADQNKANATLTTLDGSASTGTSLTYLWEKVSGTGGTLSSSTVVGPTYTTHAATDDVTYWMLTVTDDQGRSDTDFMTVTVA